MSRSPMSQFHMIDKTCYRRREESSMVRSFFLTNGWTEAAQMEGADAVVYFACSGLRFLADEKMNEIEAIGSRMKEGADLIGVVLILEFEFDGLQAIDLTHSQILHESKINHNQETFRFATGLFRRAGTSRPTEITRANRMAGTTRGEVCADHQ